jgi:GNAT superfamily N-acetyltransferase
VILREATAEDVPALVPLVAALGYPTDAARLGAAMAAILAHPDYRTVVAEEGGRLLGLAGMRRGLGYEVGLFVQFAALVVDPDHQGRGIGRALVREVEGWARSLGAEVVTLNSGHHRAGAHRFYERLGYAATGLRFVKRLRDDA